jgi:hypothetical protein
VKSRASDVTSPSFVATTLLLDFQTQHGSITVISFTTSSFSYDTRVALEHSEVSSVRACMYAAAFHTPSLGMYLAIMRSLQI